MISEVAYHGIRCVQAASFGGTNIDPVAWEDKKCPGESRFPAQVLPFDHAIRAKLVL